MGESALLYCGLCGLSPVRALDETGSVHTCLRSVTRSPMKYLEEVYAGECETDLESYSGKVNDLDQPVFQRIESNTQSLLKKSEA